MKIEKVLVIGSGTMGSGIAQWMTQAGCQVQLSDLDLDFAKKNLEKVFNSWDKLQAKGKFSSQEVDNFKNNISIVPSGSWGANNDLVIEAIVENLDIKCQLFNDLDKKMEKKTIFASNTSSIPIDSMAKGLDSARREKFLGLHFFNPAPIMKLVEVISGHWTDKEMARNLFSWFAEHGKKPALCKDGPGFIVNRVARNFYGEALRIVGTDIKEKIIETDSILTEVGGFRMGPFTLMDLIGIDINYAVTESVWKSFYHEPRFAPHALQKSMVTSGRLGKKSKQGFYDYE